jgi:hypothetical protein
MHAWAEIQHKLAYKKEYQIESGLKRKFSRLSAKLEDADEEFEELRMLSKNYRENLIADQKEKGDTFQNLKSLDLDSLQAFLDYHFPDRKRDKSSTSELLDELLEVGMTFKNLNELLDSAKNFVTDVMELEENANYTQTGVIRGALYLLNDKYWTYYKTKVIKSHPSWVNTTENWRQKFKNNNT